MIERTWDPDAVYQWAEEAGERCQQCGRWGSDCECPTDDEEGGDE